MKTWIKLYRTFYEEWQWYTDVPTKTLFLHLLLKANYQNRKYKGYLIKRGDVVIGRKILAKQTGLSEQQVRTGLSKLSSTQEVTIKPTNKFSIITICNYALYQDKKTIKQPPKQPSSNQQPTTLLDNIDIKDIYNPDSFETKISIRFQKAKLNNGFSNYESIKEANLGSWAETIDKLQRLDGKSKEEIKSVIKFALEDNFWKNNLLSLAVLRDKSKNDLTKYENILNAMKQRTPDKQTKLEYSVHEL